jgi:hypothetical protein
MLTGSLHFFSLELLRIVLNKKNQTCHDTADCGADANSPHNTHPIAHQPDPLQLHADVAAQMLRNRIHVRFTN